MPVAQLRALAVAALCGAFVGGAVAAGVLGYIMGPKDAA